MSPVIWPSPPTVNRFPRVSGDEPSPDAQRRTETSFSPRERG